MVLTPRVDKGFVVVDTTKYISDKNETGGERERGREGERVDGACIWQAVV